MTGELNDTTVVILGGILNTGDTDPTLGTGELTKHFYMHESLFNTLRCDS